MIGQTISHYRVLEKLGEGGMGVVYKAEDTKLLRPVALKFLSPQWLSDSEAKKRFMREAQAAAALQHPNVCPVHEIDEVAGRLFISMAFLEGRELSAEIEEGPIAADRTIQLAAQFAEGLAEAHSMGIVHRDIKPANLFVTTSDRGVILDFGLAQLVAPESKLTREGATLGTCAYMSPEQTSGHDIDPRTDVWSLGCVLYEMLTGEQAFRGHYDQAIIYSILHEQPVPLENAQPEIEAVIQRCLAKSPEDRYPDAAAVLEALRGRPVQIASSGPSPKAHPSDVPRVAVLPLRARAGDEEMESFAEELTEEITSGLALFHHLVVVSSQVAADVRGNSDATKAGKEIGARYVVEGRVQKAGANIRVSVRLVESSTGAHLWSERIDRDLTSIDIFEVQDELTDRIVATIGDPFGVLTRSLCSFAKAKPIESLTAHDCVLRTFGYLQQPHPDEHAEVRSALERVLEREPGHAEATACLAQMYLDEFRMDYNLRPDPLNRALRVAQRAAALDTTSQLAHMTLAQAHFCRKELSAFRPVVDRALSLNPRDTSNLAELGNLKAFSGDWEAGCAIVSRAMQLNRHPVGWMHFVFVIDHYRKGEYDRALAAAEKINMPMHYWSSVLLAMVNGQLGRTGEASKHLATVLELEPDFAQTVRMRLARVAPPFPPELMERFIDGLRKAGLAVDKPAEPSTLEDA